MHASAQLLPLLRSPFQGELLAWLFLHPEEEWSATDLARKFGVSQPTASREADRLAEARLIDERRTGNLRLLRARTDTVVARPLTDLLAVTYGPLAIIGDLLSHVAGVDEALIHGSWAARYRGEAGAVPNDVDVLVIGTADDDDLAEVARTAERRLGRGVDIRRVDPDGWRRQDPDPFLDSVRAGPSVALDIGKQHA
jgi:DNA-binding transcriptional ArsR family regulator